MVLLAAFLWGSNGIFVHLMAGSVLNSYEMSCVRLIAAALLEGIYMICRKREALKIDARDLPWFMLSGCFGCFLFTISYTLCIHYTGMGTAAVLIYLMPSIVMTFSCVFMKERFTFWKGLSAFLSLSGCALVSGIANNASMNLKGILIGIFAAFCYASYNLIASIKLKSYSSLTRMFYPTLIASILSVFYLFLYDGYSHLLCAYRLNISYLFINVLWAICCSIATYYLFNKAIDHMEVSKASILLTFEPLAATLLGVLLFQERIDFWGILGVVCVFTALLLTEIKSDK